MITTLILVNFTPQSMPQHPERNWHVNVLHAQVNDLASCDEIGGSLIHLWWTSGPYDVVIVAELPDQERIAAFSITLSKKFSARTTTLTALDTDQMQPVIDIVAIKDGV